MFRHVVMFTFKDGSTEVQKEALAAALHQLPELIPEIRSYSLGRDLGLRDDNYEFAVTADFDDADGFLVYSNHPDHLKAIAELPLRSPRRERRCSSSGRRHCRPTC